MSHTLNEIAAGLAQVVQSEELMKQLCASIRKAQNAQPAPM